MRFFNIIIIIKFPLFRVSVTIEPGRCLLELVTTNCLTVLKQKFSEKFGSNPILF